MFDELKDNEPQEPEPKGDKVTLGEALGVYVMILLLGFFSVAVFISLEGHRHGLQLATMFSYSGAVFIWTFFRTRGINTKYPLDEPYVQEQLPKLLGIHCLYIIGVDTLETASFAFAPHLSPWWFTTSDSKGMPPFQLSLMLCIGAIGITQVVVLRRILHRARQKDLSQQAGGE